jgi:hypothetical protein
LAVQAGNIKVPQNGVFRGVVATFTDGGPTEVATSYRATVAWGKGRKAAGMITGSNGRFVVSARHAFPRFRGTRPVTITVTDPDGQTVSVTESASEVARHARIIKVAGRARADARSHR